MTASATIGSNNRVLGSPAPFRAGPDDIVEGVLDLAGLAVQAVGRVELEPLPAPFGRLHFVHLSRAEPGAGAAEGVPAAGHAELAVGDDEVAGLILLVGIAKKNSIMLVDFTNQIREKGVERHQALLQACPIRLRPILMTSIATIAGAMPAAFAIGPGAETQRPMALALVGGMVVSTALTLFVVPAAYSVLGDALEWNARRRQVRDGRQPA